MAPNITEKYNFIEKKITSSRRQSFSTKLSNLKKCAEIFLGRLVLVEISGMDGLFWI